MASLQTIIHGAGVIATAAGASMAIVSVAQYDGEALVDAAERGEP